MNRLAGLSQCVSSLAAGRAAATSSENLLSVTISVVLGKASGLFDSGVGQDPGEPSHRRAARGPVSGRTCAGRLVCPTVHSIAAESIEAPFSDQGQQIGPAAERNQVGGVGLAIPIYIYV